MQTNHRQYICWPQGRAWLLLFVLTVGVADFSYGAELSRWLLNEASGTAVTDSVAGNNGIYVSGVTLGTAALCEGGNAAARFDGNNEYAEIPHNSAYLLDNGSVSLWVNPERTDRRQDLFSKDTTNFHTGGHLTIYLDGSSVQVRQQSTSQSQGLSVSSAMTAGTWTHIVYTWGSTGMRLYIDGTLSASNSYTGGLGASSGGIGNEEPIALGTGTITSGVGTVLPTNNHYQGLIADVRLFDAALIETDIVDLSQCSDAPATPDTDGDLGRWLLDETSGTNAIDSIAANTGVYTGGVTFGSEGPCGDGGLAVNFDGANDYLEISHHPDYLLDSGAVAFWVRPADISGTQALVSKDSNGYDNGGHLHIYIIGDDMNVRLQSTSTSYTLQVSNVALVNQWLHVGVLWGDAGLRLFIDGVLQDSDSYTGGLGSTSGGSGNQEPIAVGASSNTSGNGVVTPLNQYFNGAISDLRIIGGSPSDAEISNLGSCATSNTDASIGHWRLNESSGLVAADSVGNNQGAYQNGALLGAEGVCSGTTSAVTLDGVNDYIEIAHDDAYLIDTGSISLWAYPNDLSGRQELFSKDSSGYDNGGHFTVYMNGDDILIRMQNTSTSYTLSAANVVQANQWFNLVFVWGSGGMRLYIDGTLVDTNSYTGGLGTSSGGSGNREPIAIGANTWSSGNEVITPLRDYFVGKMSDVRIYDRALSSSEVAALDPCAITLTALSLLHDGSGIHCVDEVITLTAIDGDGDVITSFGQQVTLDTQSGLGRWSLVSGSGSFTDTTVTDGLATYTFASADAGTAQFALSYLDDGSALDVDAFVTADPSIRDIDSEGTLQFSPSGFTVTQNPLPNPPPSPIADDLVSQIASRSFNAHLTAYGQTPDDATCGVIEAYSGTRAVKFWFDYEDPDSGTINPNVDGTAIVDVAADAVAQEVNFASGQASISINYADAGSIRLLMEDDDSFVNTISGSSNAVVVKPSALVVSQVRSSGVILNTTATSMGDLGFAAAGEAFVVQVEAVGDTGNRTPNFGLEQVPEQILVSSPALEFPIGGRHGSSGNVQNGTGFVLTGTPGRLENSSVIYDEVGIINLQADLVDGDYLGAGAVNTPLRSGVGRFYPATFALRLGQVGSGCGDFTYLSQPALNVTFEIEARTLGGARTLNYDASLLGFGVLALVTPVAENANNGIDLSARLSALVGSWTQGRYLVDTSAASLSRAASVDGPFTSLQLGLAVTDDPDSVSLADLDMNATSTGLCGSGSCSARQLGSATQLYYGRLLLAAAGGPETQDLNSPLVAQVFSGAGFTHHTADNCTNYVNSSATLADYSGNLELGETVVSGPVATTELVQGLHQPLAPMLLSAPGLGNVGTVVMSLDVPSWLEFDWTGTGLEDPSAIYTFGVFRGHDRIIFWRSL